MAYSIKGDLNEDARVVVIDEITGTLENAFAFSTGEWELITPDDNYKIVLAIRADSGESYGYSQVTPVTYIMSLAVNSTGDILAINNLGDTLAISF